MKGNNEIILNQATVEEAMQEWIEKRWQNAVDPMPVVDGVERVDNNPGGLRLKVRLKSEEK